MCFTFLLPLFIIDYTEILSQSHDWILPEEREEDPGQNAGGSEE